MFSIAENAKDGASLAAPRRTARAARRILHRKTIRIQQIKELLEKFAILNKEQIGSIHTNQQSPWDIRSKALDEKLNGLELSKALLHIAKRRGFKSMRKAQEEEDKGETGQLLKGIKEMTELFKKKDCKTIGQMLSKVPGIYPKRNKYGSYSNSISRKLLEDEVSIIFNQQRILGSALASKEFEADFKKIAFTQRPIQSMAAMVGKCTLEPPMQDGPLKMLIHLKFLPQYQG